MIQAILGIRFAPQWEAKLSTVGWLVFRVGIGLMMAPHGFGKLMNFSKIAPNFMNFMGLGGSISLALVVAAEFFGALAVMFGFLTRWAAFSIVFTMSVAAFIAHAADPFAKKELALLYALVFLFPLIAGGGKFSLDSLIAKKRKRTLS